MPVNTAKVEGRRKVNYASLDELLAEAERFKSGSVKTLGNWSPGMIYKHLATAFNGSIDGLPDAFPWHIRLVGRLFKKRLIAGSMPAGIKLPDRFAKAVLPEATPDEVGLAELRKAVARLKKEPQRAKHPVFGDLTREEWDRVHLMHSNLHMSYLLPQ
jgi:hypothetical protein